MHSCICIPLYCIHRVILTNPTNISLMFIAIMWWYCGMYCSLFYNTLWCDQDKIADTSEFSILCIFLMDGLNSYSLSMDKLLLQFCPYNVIYLFNQVPGTRGNYNGIFHALQEITKQEGLQGLHRYTILLWLVVWLHICLVLAVMLSLYLCI